MALWCQSNLDIIFFIYGLAFVIMGIAVWVQPRKGSEFKLADILWLLSGFGLIHGANEWLDMWSILRGRHIGLDIFRWAILVVSYICLFEFGRRIFHLSSSKYTSWLKGIIAPSAWWLVLVILFVIFLFGVTSHDFWKVGSIWTRYLLCFPGGLLTGLGFFLYYANTKEILQPLNVKKYFWGAGLAFLIYSILGGLVVPKENFFPASWLNNESFLLAVGFPVQALRALCAILSAWGICGLLKIFHWETIARLQRDISERKKVEEELRSAYDILKQTQAQLLQTEKMAAIGQLAGGVAHEIKNPLAIILQGLEYLKDSASPNPILLDPIERLTKAALRADKIIKGLLNFARQSPFILEKSDIIPVIEESLSLVEHQMGLKNIKIIRQFPQGLPQIKIDTNQMKQVIINILVNSVDAMSQGGTITIRAERIEVQPGNDYLQIKWTDTGCGIPSEHLLRVFDPFFTTKSKEGSAGLGLSVTKGIIEGHKGTINIESKENVGTNVIIRLPVTTSSNKFSLV